MAILIELIEHELGKRNFIISAGQFPFKNLERDTRR